MLVRHCELATECGVPSSNCFVMENGDVLELTREKGQKNGRIKSGVILIDSSRAWQIDDAIVEDRRHLAEDGLVTVSLTLNKKRKAVIGPDVALKGIILPRGVPPEEFVIKVQAVVRAILEDAKVMETLQEQDLHSYLLGALSRYFADQMRAKPLVQVILHHTSSSAGRTPMKALKPSAKTKGV